MIIYIIMAVVFVGSTLTNAPLKAFGQSHPLDNNNFTLYDGRIGTSLKYPQNWHKSENSTAVIFSSPKINDANLTLKVEKTPPNIENLNDFIENSDSVYKGGIDLTIRGQPVNKLDFVTNNTRGIQLVSMKGENVYTLLSFTNKYPYLSTVQMMIDSFINYLVQKEPSELGGIPVNRPTDIAVNPTTNMIYVIQGPSDRVLVINGYDEEIMDSIQLDGSLKSISINPNNNIVYVISNNTVFLIDGNINKPISNFTLNDIRDSAELENIAIDNGGTIYVADDNRTLYAILTQNNEVSQDNMKAIRVGQEPNAIATNVNTDSGLLFLTHWERQEREGALQVIDGEEGDVVASIEAGRHPSDVVINPYTDNIYALESQKLHIFDGKSLQQINEIELNSTMRNMAINPNTNKIYVTPVYTNEINVIDELEGKVVSTILVGAPDRGGSNLENRYEIDINPNTNMIYIANRETNRIYVVNGSTDALVSKISFNVYPTNAGEVNCKDVNSSSNYSKVSNSYRFYSNNAVVLCKTYPNTGFIFSSWSGNVTLNNVFEFPTDRWIMQLSEYEPLDRSIIQILYDNSFKKNDLTNRFITFNVTKSGSLNANFVTSAPIPTELWTPIYGIIPTIITATLIPSIILWNKGLQQSKRLRESYTQQIEIIKNLEEGDNLEKDIRKSYDDGKLKESDYQGLTRILLQKSLDKRIDALSKSSQIVENQRAVVEQIKEDVENAYSKGVISKQSRDQLNEKISKIPQNHDDR